jgi:hypothetical protein|tara:strand:+ start:296 stop:463 length:168 start_codon:yes stop_codon:yes gene_type:complete
MKVEISPESCDEIIKQELGWWINNLSSDDCSYESSSKERAKLLKAFKTVLEFYSS